MGVEGAFVLHTIEKQLQFAWRARKQSKAITQVIRVSFDDVESASFCYWSAIRAKATAATPLQSCSRYPSGDEARRESHYSFFSLHSR